MSAAEQEPLTPEELADLEAAWVELRQVADESNVTSLRACSRAGCSWGDDPDVVRSMAATIRRITNNAAEG